MDVSGVGGISRTDVGGGCDDDGGDSDNDVLVWHQTNYSCLYTEVIRHSLNSVVEYGASSMHVSVKVRYGLLVDKCTVMSAEVE